VNGCRFCGCDYERLVPFYVLSTTQGELGLSRIMEKGVSHSGFISSVVRCYSYLYCCIYQDYTNVMDKDDVLVHMCVCAQKHVFFVCVCVCNKLLRYLKHFNSCTMSSARI
jgi:hypothetical protein